MISRWKDIPWEAEFWALATPFTSKSTDNCTAWKRPARHRCGHCVTQWNLHAFHQGEETQGSQGNEELSEAFEYMGWERNALHRWTPSAPGLTTQSAKMNPVCVTVHKINKVLPEVCFPIKMNPIRLFCSWLPLALMISFSLQSPQLSSKIGRLLEEGHVSQPQSMRKFVRQRRKDEAFQGKRTAGEGGGSYLRTWCAWKTARNPCGWLERIYSDRGEAGHLDGHHTIGEANPGPGQPWLQGE